MHILQESNRKSEGRRFDYCKGALRIFPSNHEATSKNKSFQAAHFSQRVCHGIPVLCCDLRDQS